MVPPKKRMSWNRFPTNFVCVRFFLSFFFFFFAVSSVFHFFETQWFLTENKVILLSTVNGVETFMTSRTGITNSLVHI